MVIRVTRSHVSVGREEEFSKDIRESALPKIADDAGIVYGAFGRRVDGERHVFISISVWDDMGALMRLTGDDLHAPLELDGASELVDDSSVELYELVGEWGRVLENEP